MNVMRKTASGCHPTGIGRVGVARRSQRFLDAAACVPPGRVAAAASILGRPGQPCGGPVGPDGGAVALAGARAGSSAGLVGDPGASDGGPAVPGGRLQHPRAASIVRAVGEYLTGKGAKRGRKSSHGQAARRKCLPGVVKADMQGIDRQAAPGAGGRHLANLDGQRPDTPAAATVAAQGRAYRLLQAEALNRAVDGRQAGRAAGGRATHGRLWRRSCGYDYLGRDCSAQGAPRLGATVAPKRSAFAAGRAASGGRAADAGRAARARGGSKPPSPAATGPAAAVSACPASVESAPTPEQAPGVKEPAPPPSEASTEVPGAAAERPGAAAACRVRALRRSPATETPEAAPADPDLTLDGPDLTDDADGDSGAVDTGLDDFLDGLGADAGPPPTPADG